jgi:hypothetical protein
MSFEITGKLVEKFDAVEISSKFRKREFVIETKDNSNGFEFTEHIKFQLTQDKCSLIENIPQDSNIKVNFNIRGRKWEKDGNTSYFTNLEAWKIENLSEMSETSPNTSSTADDVPLPSEEDFSGNTSQEFDDLPF